MPLSESITLHSAQRSFINLMIFKARSIAHLSTMVGNDLKSLSIYYKDDTGQMKRIMDEVKFFEKQLQPAAFDSAQRYDKKYHFLQRFSVAVTFSSA